MEGGGGLEEGGGGLEEGGGGLEEGGGGLEEQSGGSEERGSSWKSKEGKEKRVRWGRGVGGGDDRRKELKVQEAGVREPGGGGGCTHCK